MTIEKIKELKAKAHVIEPVVWIGKAGLTKEVVEEMKKQLKKKQLIKVKLLKPALENTCKKDLAKKIAEETGSELVTQVGFVAVLYKANTAKSI